MIGLCDDLLQSQASRGHRFSFLRGDPGKRGIGVPLPVDAYYVELGLVIEYHERQHIEAVPHFDKRPTVSKVARGEQRRIYDERRQVILRQNNIILVILRFDHFDHRRGKLVRLRDADCAVIRRELMAQAPSVEVH